MAGELKLNAVAAPATPAAGKHGLYVSNVTLPRLSRVDEAGTVWPSADVFLLSQSADYTLTSTATAQKAFNASTNGAITLPASSGYLFDALYMISNTGTTSHTWGTLFAGTATITSIGYGVQARTGITSANTITAMSSLIVSVATVVPVTAASTSATEFVHIQLTGTVRINGGGTFIPQIKASADPVGTQKMLAGSYFKLTPLGTDTAVTLGNWS